MTTLSREELGLAKAGSHDDKAAKTHAGMANWAGGGPKGATCAGCTFFSDQPSKYGLKSNEGLCEKYKAMMRTARVKKVGGPVRGHFFPGTAEACLYFDRKVMR